MLERRSPLHQGMALHMSDASTAGLRVLAVLHSASGAAAEQAVLWRMLEQGQRYRPYDAEALRFYRDKTGHPVSAAQAQRALEALRQRTPALVWKSARGEYALEDAAMHRWFETRKEADQWPPAAPQGLLPLDDD